jgi:hypothetical protein
MRTNLRQSEQLGGLEPTMPRDDLIRVVGQDRGVEPERLDAFGDCPYLSRPVDARILWIRAKVANRHKLKPTSEGSGVLRRWLGHRTSRQKKIAVISAPADAIS